MNPLVEADVDIQGFTASRGWRSTIIGGLAVQRWGEPRQTRDVDLALLTGIGREDAFIDPLLAHYAGRRPDARAFALTYRVLLIESTAGIPLDVSLAALPFEERVMDRSTPFEFAAGGVVTTCSAEDLVALKAFADRPQDWLDVEGIIVRQGAALDRTLVLAELLPLHELKEESAPEGTLRKLFSRHERAQACRAELAGRFATPVARPTPPSGGPALGRRAGRHRWRRWGRFSGRRLWILQRTNEGSKRTRRSLGGESGDGPARSTRLQSPPHARVRVRSRLPIRAPRPRTHPRRSAGLAGARRRAGPWRDRSRRRPRRSRGCRGAARGSASGRRCRRAGRSGQRQ